MGWEEALLRHRLINAPVTPDNLSFLGQWQQLEGGHTNNNATYNWLNTTLGRDFPSINSHGVRAYPDQQTGISQLAASLLSDHGQRYGGILAAMRSGHGLKAFQEAPSEFSTWGTKIPSAPMPAAGTPVIDAEELGLSGMLGDTFAKLHENMAGLLGTTQADAAEAAGQRDQFMGQMQGIVNQPPPENDPGAEFATRLLGQLSSALNPQGGGAQLAEQTLGERKSRIMNQRSQQLELLAMKHKEAAARAEKLGDYEQQLKHEEKVGLYLKQAELGIQELRAQGILNREKRTTDRQTAADERQARLDEQRAKKDEQERLDKQDSDVYGRITNSISHYRKRASERRADADRLEKAPAKGQPKPEDLTKANTYRKDAANYEQLAVVADQITAAQRARGERPDPALAMKQAVVEIAKRDAADMAAGRMAYLSFEQMKAAIDTMSETEWQDSAFGQTGLTRDQTLAIHEAVWRQAGLDLVGDPVGHARDVQIGRERLLRNRRDRDFTPEVPSTF